MFQAYEKALAGVGRGMDLQYEGDVQAALFW